VKAIGGDCIFVVHANGSVKMVWYVSS